MISTSISVAGCSAGIELATSRERQVDDACAAQDAATETRSAGLAPSRLDRLRDEPGVLGRFDAR